MGKQGYGEGVCSLLNGLLREVLRRLNFEWGAPLYPDEGLADEAEVDSEAEIGSVDEDDLPVNDQEDELMYQEEEVKNVQAQYTELNEHVLNLQIRLKTITEDLDMVKVEMEEKSTTVTDTAPIVKMKDSFKRLRADTRQLEVRIGVVSHTLMQAKLRQRPTETGRAYGGGPGGVNMDQYNDDDDD